MTTPKLFVFSIFLASLFVIIAPQKLLLEQEVAISSVTVRTELEKLKMEVSILESTIEKSDNKVKNQDDGIKQMENIILEKSQVSQPYRIISKLFSFRKLVMNRRLESTWLKRLLK